MCAGAHVFMIHRIFATIIVALLAAGCPASRQETPRPPTGAAALYVPPGPAPPAAVAVAVAVDSPPAPTAVADAPGEVPITLPILDAMFTDPAFAVALGARLGLSDAQIGQLRVAARTATAGLTESEDGSTQAAADHADAQIRGILDEVQRQGLTKLVHERWRMDEDGSIDLPTAAQDQARGIPSDTRIVVNAPAYRMDIFRDGELIKTYKIGIGYPEFPLPIGLRKASSIIFNPSWTPPDEPWVTGKFAAGRRVAAGNPLNPLGPIKIPIGMPSLIHGGKAAWQMGGFASHGCVGLTDSQVRDLARLLSELTSTRISSADAASYVTNTTETTRIKLASAVPVELRYETIVVEDGRLLIYRDVYERGTNTEDRVRAVLAANGVELDSLTHAERVHITRALRRMALDARGKVSADQANMHESPTSAAVTRTIKGAKEVVIEIPALKGMGYPAPVDLTTK